jgi:hypothetical protein
MTIKIIDTYNRSVVEPLGIIREDLLDDRIEFSMFPTNSPSQEYMKQMVTEGHFPAARQPEDIIEWTDTECIVTIVWNDYYAAQTHANRKMAANFPGLISSVVAEDD